MHVECLQRLWLYICIAGTAFAFGQCSWAQDYQFSPTQVSLDSPEATQQVLIWRLEKSQRQDWTREVRFEISPPDIATIDERGVVRPLRDGAAELRVKTSGPPLLVPIEVRAFGNPPPVSFRHEILPLLTKSRCNSGGCHGKAEGQNGLKLSVFGFDPLADYQALVQESRGRRVSPARPAESLVYKKALAITPHGGGLKIEPDSIADRRLLRWISEGVTFTTPDDDLTQAARIEIEPQTQVLTTGQSQQLRVTAIDAAGRRHCVTATSEFESNATVIASVDQRGLIQAADVPGEAAILVRYAEHLAVCRVTLPRPALVVSRPPENNFIDRFVWDKLQRLGIEPSELCDDAAFLRRAFLDTIGTLPTPDEAREFLNDTVDNKRQRLVEQLLDRPEYVDYWTMHWLNLLRADQLAISPQGAVAIQCWLRDSFQENKAFDQIASEFLTVQGNTSAVGPGSFYKVLNKPDEAARSISQLFLGVRIECAQCHHHPSDRWGQDDYVGLAGFFTGLTLKNLPNGEQALVSRLGKDLPHPRDGHTIATRALGEPAADFSLVTDRRRVLADWMTAPDNPYFAKAFANRMWAHYFGRGLIEPLDDLRATNPPSNEPLMLALEDHLRELKYDVKAFTRTLLLSRAYQLSSNALTSNVDDDQNFSHAGYKSLPAEVLLDAINQASATEEKFNGWPAGYRAIQVWDNRMPSYFFTIFGRPVRATVCECERSDKPSIAQALHLLNAPEIADKLESRRGRARQLADSQLPPREIVNELYLATLSRLPTEQELQLMLTAFTTLGDRRAATEDVLWVLLNSKEFIFNH